MNSQINVGICECTNLYKKELDGIIVSTENESYLVKIINIPEKDRFNILRKNKCKFFIDVHQNSDGICNTFVWNLDIKKTIKYCKFKPYLPNFYNRLLPIKELINDMKVFLEHPYYNLILIG